MSSKIVSRPVALIILLIFYFASIVVLWKIIEDGSTTRRLISAIGFMLAGIIWTVIFVKSENANTKRLNK